ncbi:hypothetical protein [Halopseudomonas pertucinogena]|uniref:Uncharacterized protein n=1 Tax=Halopseudomonas pertucinogena TaxID=86175 RepID=A0ABQ2CPB7_9GAMM|nr:hypothetical protein [Halopseudomonas pertucinogena]GGI96562.1 hypothetical protein GCM10009083_11490 [Halopseudomonas pertucinogena]
MTVSWMARRWCVVEQDEQQDLFVGDPWHMHLVDINLRLDMPLERSLCGDLLPSRPVYREVQRHTLKSLCPQCMDVARTLRNAGKRVVTRSADAVPVLNQQFDLYAQ